MARTFNGLALDHVSNGLAAEIEEILALKVVGGLKIAKEKGKQVSKTDWKSKAKDQKGIEASSGRGGNGWRSYHDEVEESGLLELSHEVLIPREDVIGTTLVLLILRRRGVGVLDLVLSVLLDELHDGLRDVGDGDLGISSEICKQGKWIGVRKGSGCAHTNTRLRL